MKKEYLLLLSILLLGFVLRTYRLDKYGLWADEKASVSQAVGFPSANVFYLSKIVPDLEELSNLGFKENTPFLPKDFWRMNTFSNIKYAAATDNGAIGYFYTLHFWTLFFGMSDASIRFLSVLFNLLTVLLSYFVAKQIFQSTEVALITAVLLAIHPMCIFSSQSAVSHSMATFFAFFSFYFFINIIQKSPAFLNYTGYVITGAISLLSNHFTAPFFIGHFLIMVFLIRDKSIWLKYLISCSIILMLYSIWFFNGGLEGFKTMAAYISNISKVEYHTYCMTPTFANITKGWGQTIWVLFGNGFQYIGFRARELLFLLLLPLYFIFNGYYNNENIKSKQLLISLAIIILSPLVVRTIIALKTNSIISFAPTWAIFMVPYAVLLLSFGIWKCYGMKTKFLFYSLIFLQCVNMVWSLFPTYWDNLFIIRNGQPRQPNPFFTASQKIKQSYTPTDTILYSTWQDAQLTNLYLNEKDNIIQKVIDNNTFTKDKVFLQKSDGSTPLTLFDFQDGELKY